MGARCGVCGQEDLDLGVGEHDGADVATLGHDVSRKAELTLAGDHGFAHGGDGRHAGDALVDLGRADLGRDVLPVGDDALRALPLGEVDSDRACDGGDGLCVRHVDAP